MANSSLPTAVAADTRGGSSAEAELLLCCARLEVSSVIRERISCLLQSGIDWNHLIYLASGHGLLPLLHWHLDELGPAALPKEVNLRLWAHYEGNARRNRVMLEELLQVLRVLEAHDIPAVPYKGPALAVAVYGDPGLREFGDLDILLRPQDVLAASRLLQEHGYVPEYDLKPDVEAAFLRSGLHYHLVLVHAQRPVMLELHWRTDTDFPVEPVSDDRWWADLAWAGLGGERIRCFGTAELLLILCLHGTRHGWSSLGWLVDVAELIRQNPDVDWPWILDKAAQLGCERRLAVGLHLARQLLNAPVPADISNRLLRWAEAEKLADRIASKLFDPEFEGWGAMRYLFFRVRLAEERPWQQLLLLKNAAFAPTLIEWSRWPLPRPLFFLYLPLRIVRLIAKYAGLEAPQSGHRH